MSLQTLSLQKPLYHAGRLTAKLIVKAKLEADVVYHAPLPKGAKIITPNHPTTTDPIWLTGILPERMRYIITHSLGQVPIANWYLKNTGHLILNSDEGRSTFDAALQYLQQGKTMAVFPEGGLSPIDDTPSRARTGVVRMALATGAPIIPVGISIRKEYVKFKPHDFSDHVKTARWYTNGPYAVTIGKPIYLEGSVEDRDRVVELSATLMDNILDLSREGNRRLALTEKRTTSLGHRQETNISRNEKHAYLKACIRRYPIRVSNPCFSLERAVS
jgi:1-acyl-sn-glycerol-3-phosphate acyltransferase